MDNVRAGDVNMLPTIPVDDIGEIRFITGSDATTRWGTGVTGGVIEIISLKRTK
jgi:outer membrane cobalamin receptor